MLLLTHSLTILLIVCEQSSCWFLDNYEHALIFSLSASILNEQSSYFFGYIAYIYDPLCHLNDTTTTTTLREPHFVIVPVIFHPNENKEIYSLLSSILHCSLAMTRVYSCRLSSDYPVYYKTVPQFDWLHSEQHSIDSLMWCIDQSDVCVFSSCNDTSTTWSKNTFLKDLQNPYIFSSRLYILLLLAHSLALYPKYHSSRVDLSCWFHRLVFLAIPLSLCSAELPVHCGLLPLELFPAALSVCDRFHWNSKWWSILFFDL